MQELVPAKGSLERSGDRTELALNALSNSLPFRAKITFPYLQMSNIVDGFGLMHRILDNNPELKKILSASTGQRCLGRDMASSYWIQLLPIDHHKICTRLRRAIVKLAILGGSKRKTVAGHHIIVFFAFAEL